MILPSVEYYASFCCIQGARNIFDFLPPMFQRYTKQVSLQPFSSIASYCSHCTSSSKEIGKPDFKSGLTLISISFLIGSSLCCHLCIKIKVELAHFSRSDNFKSKFTCSQFFQKTNLKPSSYSRVHKSPPPFFSKILEKPSIVQKKMIPHINGLGFSLI